MTPYPSGRDRAGVILVIDGRLALIERVRTPGAPPYWVVPGGGVEPGESPADTAIREAREELGLDVRLRSEEATFVVRADDHVEHYFLVDVVGGTFGSGAGPEWDPARGRGTYTPVLVPVEEAVHRDLAPFPVVEPLLRAMVTGAWAPCEVRDLRLLTPDRVRAGGFLVDEDDRVLLHRGANDRGVYFEVPGGGVEEGETPADAVVRELEEEAGVHVRIERELATIFRERQDGATGVQHYFLVRAEGDSGRVDLDHEPIFEQVWVPVAALHDLPVWPKRLGWRVAHWHAAGAWPDRPVILADSIEDLLPPCSW
jgi:8-oxo-dGTP diphosphatase